MEYVIGDKVTYNIWNRDGTIKEHTGTINDILKIPSKFNYCVSDDSNEGYSYYLTKEELKPYCGGEYPEGTTVMLQLPVKVLGYDPYADNQYLIKLQTGNGVSVDMGVTEDWLENHIK